MARQRGFFSFWQGDAADKQERLRAATVAVLGVGGLGSQVSYLLAAAGVGRLLLCDHDTVARSNLNRQLPFQDRDVGRPKVEVARERLLCLNPDLAVETFDRKIATPADVKAICAPASIVVRAIDTPPNIIFVVNEACRELGIPHVGGGFVEIWALAGPFIAADGPCFRCMLPQPPVQPAADRKAATFGPLTFWLSSYVAGDVIRYLAGLGEPWLLNRMLLLHGAEGKLFNETLKPADGACPVCAKRWAAGQMVHEGQK
ncbi:MAG: HesA/MoeB/ThiF family protein [Chloroflexi bacterium]|nr:HesA/MoeB/ThiF family protein [Chloroflexota bacterium]